MYFSLWMYTAIDGNKLISGSRLVWPWYNVFHFSADPQRARLTREPCFVLSSSGRVYVWAFQKWSYFSLIHRSARYTGAQSSMPSQAQCHSHFDTLNSARLDAPSCQFADVFGGRLKHIVLCRPYRPGTPIKIRSSDSSMH